MRIFSFFGDHVPSLYLVPSTLDLLRRCLDLGSISAADGSPSTGDFLCRWEGEPVAPFAALVELVRGGIGLGG